MSDTDGRVQAMIDWVWQVFGLPDPKPEPNVTLIYRSAQDFLLRAVDTGYGDPAMFNRYLIGTVVTCILARWTRYARGDEISCRQRMALLDALSSYLPGVEVERAVEATVEALFGVELFEGGAG